ncbi:hypothetical protein C8R44DRAFT_887855 [Mycena epipterygia]|nr:hypothetical protein C8R44DRAFT_887855 [Mycena epipterygia]
MSIMNSYDRALLLKAAVLLLLLPVVRADQVCVTSDSGTTTCHSKLTPGTIAAIVLTILLFLALLLGTVAFFFYRRRKFAEAKNAVAANAYVIEASQMQGPAQFGSHSHKSYDTRTTYDASYDPHSAPQGVLGLPTKPGSATKGSPQTAPTTYGGVTYPFKGYSSPQGTPPRSQSAFSGNYTTMSGPGSGGKVAAV